MSAPVSHSLALSARDTLPSLWPIRSLSLSSSTSSLTLRFNFTKSLVTLKSSDFIPLAVSIRTGAPEESSQTRVSTEQAIELCVRNFGIGADGVIFATPGINCTDYTMRMFNSDGSEREMCGNGVRCFARFIADLENLHGKQSFKVHTGAGGIIPEIQEDGKVKVDTAEPILKASEVPTILPANKVEAVVEAELDVDGLTWTATCISMGNPHCVIFSTKDGKDLQVDELNLAEIGPKFEHHSMFPARTNTEFVQVYFSSHLKMHVWERGAGATLACGTGACATVVAAVLEGRAKRTCIVELPGGLLEIEWREKDNYIYMTGPTEAVF